MKRFLKNLGPSFWLIMMIALVAGCCTSLNETNTLNQQTTRWADNPQNVEDFMQSTVSILNPTNDKMSCSGFFISPELILSARHCYTSPMGANTSEEMRAVLVALEHIKLWIVPYSSYASAGKDTIGYGVHVVQMPTKQLEHVIKDNDMILLKLNEGMPRSEHWLELAADNPPLGAEVYSVSLPGNQPWLFTQGVISQYYYDFDNFPNVKMLAVSISLDHGSSGSALVDNQGKVVGLAHRMDDTKHNLIFIPVTTLRTFVYGWVE